ncbi:B-box domain protein 30 [Solanum pennellii]|uniref:B-box domain protein 30 n=1 Tax=Solanum pennellii TaxID=28526 RepID=A0ABM1H8A7_SOLPN|nr:B-box domain protein 30 [Solanum pennellii]
MCSGRREGEEETSSTSYCKGPSKEGESIISSAITCALCSSEASVYCEADNAFLCRKCDRSVHGANFLAQRHIRCLLCSVCRKTTRRFLIGTSSELILPTIARLEQRNRSRSAESETTDYRTTPQELFLFI